MCAQHFPVNDHHQNDIGSRTFTPPTLPKTISAASCEPQAAIAAETALHHVDRILLSRLHDALLPEPIMAFLTQDWRDVMVKTWDNDGPDSSEWLEVHQLIDHLVWAVRTSHDERSRQRLQRVRKDVLRTMIHSMENNFLPRDHILNLASIVDQTFTAIESQQLSRIEMVALRPRQLQESRDTNCGEKRRGEMTAVERQKLKIQSSAREYLFRAVSLEEGTWVLYSPPNNARAFHCRLARAGTDTASYLFLNCFGAYVLEQTVGELAF
ncbi:MAG: DUF1631 family protein, partial [Pseudomonadota bacterium]